MMCSQSLWGLLLACSLLPLASAFLPTAHFPGSQLSLGLQGGRVAWQKPQLALVMAEVADGHDTSQIILAQDQNLNLAPRDLFRHRRAFIGKAAGLAFILSSAEYVSAADGEKSYENSKLGYQLSYPADWKESKKPVKTHLDEIQFKSGTNRGSELGVSVDPIKIDSLPSFGTPDEVGKRVVSVEKAKDGVSSAKLIGTSKEEVDGIVYYTLEYESESSRGNKHFIAKVAVANRKLYVLTGQAKIDKYEQDKENLKQGIASFRVVAV